LLVNLLDDGIAPFVTRATVRPDASPLHKTAPALTNPSEVNGVDISSPLK
jgi:hypothetical protein